MKEIELNRNEENALKKKYREGIFVTVVVAILCPVFMTFIGFFPSKIFRSSIRSSNENLYEVLGTQNAIFLIVAATIVFSTSVLFQKNIFNLKKDTKDLKKIIVVDVVLEFREHDGNYFAIMKQNNPGLIYFSANNLVELFTEDVIEFVVYKHSKELIRVNKLL